MHYGFMQTAYRQSFGGDYRDGKGMDGQQLFQQLLGELHKVGRCLTTKSDGVFPGIRGKLPENVVMVLDCGLSGYFTAEPNPGVDYYGPNSPVMKSVFRKMVKVAKRNGLRLEYHSIGPDDILPELQKLATNGEKLDI